MSSRHINTSRFTICILLTTAMFISVTSTSIAIVMDTKGPRINYCPDETLGKLDRPKPDTTCLKVESNKILFMKLKDIGAKLKQMKIEDIVDVYLCAYQADFGDDKKLETIANAILENFSSNSGYLLLRLKQESDDPRATGILLVFIVYAWTAYEKECQSQGECPRDGEHILQADVARALVARAEAVQDCGERNGLLDYLLPFLPLEEGLAKQKAREEEARRKAGNQE